jgi:hypothetical protein
MNSLRDVGYVAVSVPYVDSAVESLMHQQLLSPFPSAGNTAIIDKS